MFDVNTLIANGGLLLIGFMVFAESGLLFGFFFPGDTLLLAAGIFAAQGQLSLPSAIAVIVVSAILGGRVGYLIGEKAGPSLFKKEDGILFRREYVTRAENFYEKHGGKTIILARFLPVIRTFAPVVAGIGKMNLTRFNLYNIIGSSLWAIGVTMVGYLFGTKIPNIDTYILPVFITVSVLTFGSPIYQILRDPASRKKLASKFIRKRY